MCCRSVDDGFGRSNGLINILFIRNWTEKFSSPKIAFNGDQRKKRRDNGVNSKVDFNVRIGLKANCEEKLAAGNCRRPLKFSFHFHLISRAFDKRDGDDY